MFGIKIVTRKGLAKIEEEAMNRAVSNLVVLLRRKDRIYLEPVTLVGDGQTIQDCAFLGIEGTALTVESSKDVTV